MTSEPAAVRPTRGPAADPSGEPMVSVVVLNWNSVEHTLACLASLRAQTYRHCEVIVVDNASDDIAALGRLAAEGTIKLIRNQRNLGFTGGVNIGITEALRGKASYIWLLNNDALAAPTAIAELVAAAAADPRIGLASPVIMCHDDCDRLEFHGGLFNPANMTFQTTIDPETYRAWRAGLPDRVWLVGTALLLRRQLAQKIGLFDDRFFAYWEDNDFSLRSIRAGFRNVVVPSATVYHGTARKDCAIMAGSVPVKPPYFYYYMARNQILLMRKHCGLKPRPLIWALHAQHTAWWRLRENVAVADAICAGVADGISDVGGEYDPTRRGAVRFGRLALCGLAGALSALGRA